MLVGSFTYFEYYECLPCFKLDAGKYRQLFLTVTRLLCVFYFNVPIVQVCKRLLLNVCMTFSVRNIRRESEQDNFWDGFYRNLVPWLISQPRDIIKSFTRRSDGPFFRFSSRLRNLEWCSEHHRIFDFLSLWALTNQLGIMLVEHEGGDVWTVCTRNHKIVIAMFLRS